MKKVMLAVATAAAVLTIGGSGVGMSLTAQAKASTTLKTVPRRYRHTWYHYEHGRLATLTFTTKKITGLSYDGGQPIKYVAHLHHHQLTAKKLQQHNSWSTAVTTKRRQAQWLNMRGWNQVMGAGDYYKVMTKTVAGQRVRVLSQAGGAGVWTSAHYYQSKQLAKHQGQHTFKGEVYYTHKVKR